MRATPSPPHDAASLQGLRAQATADPRGAARAAAVQFEALFMQMVVRSMRDATPKMADAMPGGGQDNFTAMLDAKFAAHAAGRPGGLADMIERQLARHMQALPAQAPAPPPALPGSPGTPQPGVKAGAPRLDRPDAPPSDVPAAARQSGIAARSAHAQAFVRDMLPHALESERRTGLPAAFVLGHAALESGWGRNQPRQPDGRSSFNLFGIKAPGAGDGDRVKATTNEYEHGNWVERREAFRSYASYAQAFADHARLLTTSARYAAAVRGADASPEAFAAGLQRAGYATDPRYADKLAATIRVAQAIQREVSS